MRKVIVMNRITLDGYFAGPNGEIDWFIHDPEVDQAAHELMHPDTVLFGRVTYQMFESYWPGVAADANAPEGARRTANELNQMAKVVFSGSLPGVGWVNSILVSDGLNTAVEKLKQTAGGDFVIFGSGTLVQQLANAALIDEYLLIVTPVVLGAGKKLFQGVTKMSLQLVEMRSFASGNVLLHYLS